MDTIIPIIIEPILEACETKLIAQSHEHEEEGAEFDLDSDDEDGEVVGFDLEGTDEQVSAIHCIGNLCLYCSGIMQPYLEKVCEKFKDAGENVHENVRYHISLSLT